MRRNVTICRPGFERSWKDINIWGKAFTCSLKFNTWSALAILLRAMSCMNRSWRMTCSGWKCKRFCQELSVNVRYIVRTPHTAETEKENIFRPITSCSQMFRLRDIILLSPPTIVMALYCAHHPGGNRQGVGLGDDTWTMEMIPVTMTTRLGGFR